MDDPSKRFTVVILAAGQGKRMRSSLPKVLHPLAGRPIVGHVLAAAANAGLKGPVVVVGAQADDVRKAVGAEATCVVQAEPLGTGHAVAQAKDALGTSEHVMVLNGDVPLIRPRSLQKLMEAHLDGEADLTFVTATVPDAEEYGVVERDAGGRVVRLVESADRQKGVEGPAEINSGQYCLRASWLWPRLTTLPASSSGEYYLTSLVAKGVEEGAAVHAIRVDDAEEVMGINDRVQLAAAELALRARISRGHQRAGVTLADPATTYIDVDVTIGQDSVIEPNTHLLGGVAIGAGCHVGPDTTIRDAVLGTGCRVVASTIEGATLEDGVEVGPYSHVRAGSYLGAGVHVGNYAEIKNARLERGVKMGHFSYIGDAEVGEGTNIGAGTITCNFDGEQKHRTVIGRGVFLGSDTKLVAPVSIGDGARTGAGSVVTRDVPADALAVGAPARIMRGDRQ